MTAPRDLSLSLTVMGPGYLPDLIEILGVAVMATMGPVSWEASAEACCISRMACSLASSAERCMSCIFCMAACCAA